jgi:OPA family glycerol-3-phosphate transporter-like MFS transporter
MLVKVFSPVRRFYAAPPAAPRLPESQVASLYPKFRLRALESTYIGYAIYYLVRNNVSFVTVEMQNTLGYTKEMIGDITAMTALAYGLSKFLMGSVSDKSNSRLFISTGLFLTAVCNFAFGASTNYYAHLTLWTLNGFAQGMGWPPCGRVMSHWFSESERGLTFSFWNTSHNLGAGIIGVFVAWVVGEFGGWQYAFYVPGAIAAVMSIYLFLRVPDTPESVGLPPVEEFRNDYPPEGETVDLDRELSFRELLLDKVLLNKWIWLLAIANFFVYICRYSMMDWSPTYLREVKAANISKGALAVMVLEFSAIPSTIFFGWVSDRIGGRRGMVATLCMIPIIAAFAGIIAAPKGMLWLDYLMLGAIGCFVYPVLGLITVAALDMVSKKAIGAAAGFIGLFGYLGRVVQDKGFGRLLDQLTATYGKEYAWEIVLYIIMFCAILATLLLALLWKLRPHA